MEYLSKEGILDIDDFRLGAWACEEHFDRILCIRQKCYITEENGETNVTVSGLPKYLTPIISFENFRRGFTTTGLNQEQMIELARKNDATPEELEAIHHKTTYKHVNGGVILVDTDFTIK